MNLSARQILHVDMDAFFASVEQRDNPTLRGKPVVVGGPSRRGVVAAASYEVREFGVRSAMPMAEALRRCPHVIVVSGNYARYSEVSRHVFSIFHRYTPLVEGLSLDEAFLDVTASRSLWGDGETIATLIRRAIEEELDLTASAGVAPSKFVAKIASDVNKPDGLCVVRAGEVRAFLAPLPIERMWTIGPRSAPRAHAAGFHTIGDLANATEERLRASFGEHGVVLGSLARGEDERGVSPAREAKSIGAEETFEVDYHTIDELAPQLLSQSERVARRLYGESLGARTITVKIKYADFTLKTRTMQLPDSVSDTDSIYKAALTLIERFEPGARFRKGIRLTGVSASGLEPISLNLSLFPNPEVERGRRLEGALASLRERFGEAGAQRAALMERKGSMERKGWMERKGRRS